MTAMSRLPEADPLYARPSPERPVYATGMLLDASDFTAEQTYHRGRLARALALSTGGGKTSGVRLDTGEEIRAPIVVSNLDVKRTFLKTIDANDLPAEFVERVRNFRIRGSSGKLNIALDRAPRFTALPEGAPNIKGDLHFTDSLEKMERAYDDWKAGHYSADPFQDMMIPTMIGIAIGIGLSAAATRLPPLVATSLPLISPATRAGLQRGRPTNRLQSINGTLA